MLESDKEFFGDLIIRKIEILLQEAMDDPDLILNLKDGEDTVCPVCDRIEKVCKKIPDFRCKNALKGDTELSELENALDRIRKDTYGKCSICLENISKDKLKKNLTLMICDKCSRKTKIIKKKKSDTSQTALQKNPNLINE